MNTLHISRTIQRGIGSDESFLAGDGSRQRGRGGLSRLATLRLFLDLRSPSTTNLRHKRLHSHFYSQSLFLPVHLLGYATKKVKSQNGSGGFLLGMTKKSSGALPRNGSK